MLAEGKVIARGDADTIAHDERVVNLYLGADVMHARPRDEVAEGAVAP